MDGILDLLSLLCLLAAGLAALTAIVLQWRDATPKRGGTMGGEMTSGVLWFLSSLLAAIGAGHFLPWYFAPLVFLGLLVLSFAFRIVLLRLAQLQKSARPN